MTIYLNGQYLPIEQAKISVLDRGFIFGDGVYEVVPVYSRRPFRIGEHLRRLQRSLDEIRLANPHDNAEWVAIASEIIARNEGADMSLLFQVTRGAARRDHAFPVPPVAPTVFVMSNPLTHPPAQLLKSGIACITAPDNRWLRCDIKSIALLPNVLLSQMAVDAGCVETVLIRTDPANGARFLTEGAASNIFAVKNGTLLASPKDNFVLPGITYDVVLELAAAHGIPHEVRRLTKDEVFAADELLLTSSTKEVLPITQLDGQPIGGGKPGAMFARLYALYQDFKREVMRA